MSEELYGLKEYLDLKFDTIDLQLQEIKTKQETSAVACETTRCSFDGRIDEMEKKWAELNGIKKKDYDSKTLLYVKMMGVGALLIVAWDVIKTYLWK
jgi:hypothetical protein